MKRRSDSAMKKIGFEKQRLMKMLLVERKTLTMKSAERRRSVKKMLEKRKMTMINVAKKMKKEGKEMKKIVFED